MNRFGLMSTHVAPYLANFRRYYPGILEWYSGLEDGFASGRRRMFVSWNGSNVDGLAITKNGNRAKFCHISVSPAARDRGLGSTLAHLALCDMVHQGAQEIRVTTSEEVFRSHGPFFRAIGFGVVDSQVNRYRRNVSELLWKLEIDPVTWRFGDSVSSVHQHRVEIFGRGSTLVRLPLLIGQISPPGRHSFYNSVCDIIKLCPPSPVQLMHRASAHIEHLFRAPAAHSRSSR